MSLRSAFALFRGQRQFHLDLIGHRRWWFILSGTFIVLSLGGLLIRGLNLGIDFRGGSALRYPIETDATPDEIRTTLERLSHPDAVVQRVTGPGGQPAITVRTEVLGDDRGEVFQALADQAGIEQGEIAEETIGPRFGQQISAKALQGLLVFLVVVTIYISFRFEWKMAVAALVALFHDLLITAGVYALVGREVTPETVIAILTILGYSLYDTVVIFDKVKENTESAALVARETYAGTVNLSLNQVLMRSVNTSLVVLFPVGALMLFGGETLQNFAFALFVGILVGTYSSIFVAAPVLALLKEREPRLAEIRQRAARREAKPSLRVVGGEERTGRTRELVPATASTAPRPGQVRRRPKKKPRSKRRRR